MYYKIRFSSRFGETAGIVLETKRFPIGQTSVEDYSRLYPMSEAMKMARLHVSPTYPTWLEAFNAEAR